MADTGKAGQGEDRLNALEIFEVVLRGARDELERSPSSLAFSGLAAGLMMGLSAMGLAAGRLAFGSEGPGLFLSNLLYPLGFVAVIIGRGQLFTENTVYPVVLVLDERGHVRDTLRLWGIVFGANQMGALLFGLLAARTGGLPSGLTGSLTELGVEAVGRGFGHLFWAGVFGGWIIALVAWLVSAGRGTGGQILLIWALTFLVGLGHFAHSVAGAAEVLAAVSGGALGVGDYARWLAPATLGNIVGGVTMVSLLNYGQVRLGEEIEGRKATDRDLPTE